MTTVVPCVLQCTLCCTVSFGDGLVPIIENREFYQHKISEGDSRHV